MLKVVNFEYCFTLMKKGIYFSYTHICDGSLDCPIRLSIDPKRG